jgi:hypothetical protein
VKRGIESFETSWLNGWMDGWIDGWMEGVKYIYYSYTSLNK